MIMETRNELLSEGLKHRLKPPLTPAQGWLRTVLFRWDILDDYDRKTMIELALKALKRVSDSVENLEYLIEEVEAQTIDIDREVP